MADDLLLPPAMNVSLKTKIRYNGQEYTSPDALPPEIRVVYERALASRAGLTANREVKTYVTINGQQFSSADELPATEKKLYDDAMQLIRDNQEAKTPITPTTTAAPCPAPIPTQSAVDTGWLTKRQIQIIILVAGLLLAVALMVALRT